MQTSIFIGTLIGANKFIDPIDLLKITRICMSIAQGIENLELELVLLLEERLRQRISASKLCHAYISDDISDDTSF